MERSVEVLAVILFGVIGLSHIVQPKAWAEFFILLRSKGEAGAFADGFLNLPLAGLIVGFHNTWSGLPAVLTLVGWCLLIKSLSLPASLAMGSTLASILSSSPTGCHHQLLTQR
jgi:hypothetical protein